jgi:hypothetical protein
MFCITRERMPMSISWYLLREKCITFLAQELVAIMVFGVLISTGAAGFGITTEKGSFFIFELSP